MLKVFNEVKPMILIDLHINKVKLVFWIDLHNVVLINIMKIGFKLL